MPGARTPNQNPSADTTKTRSVHSQPGVRLIISGEERTNGKSGRRDDVDQAEASHTHNMSIHHAQIAQTERR